MFTTGRTFPLLMFCLKNSFTLRVETNIDTQWPRVTWRKKEYLQDASKIVKVFGTALAPFPPSICALDGMLCLRRIRNRGTFSWGECEDSIRSRKLWHVG